MPIYIDSKMGGLDPERRRLLNKLNNDGKYNVMNMSVQYVAIRKMLPRNCWNHSMFVWSHGSAMMEWSAYPHTPCVELY